MGGYHFRGDIVKGGKGRGKKGGGGGNGRKDKNFDVG